jgi:hypothetical protein
MSMFKKHVWCKYVLSWLLFCSVAFATEQGYQSFLVDLAKRESGGRQDAKNQYGYLGLYQMGEAALIDAGFVKRDSTPNNNDFSGGWTGKNGVTSPEGFLANRGAQNAAIEVFHRGTWKTIQNLGLDKYIGQTIGGVQITASGLIGGAHLVGAGKVRDFLNSNGSKIPTDANGTSVTSYLSRFGGYDVSIITGIVNANDTKTNAGSQDPSNPNSTGSSQSDPSPSAGLGILDLLELAGVAGAILFIGYVIFTFVSLKVILWLVWKLAMPRHR